METALLVASVALAGVFGVAGLTKLADQPGSRQAMIDFGVPVPLAGPLGMLLPLLEIAAALALLSGQVTWLGAVVALALMLLFTLAIVVSLARGRRPACRCFGQMSAKPIGATTVVRNLVLAGLAGLVVSQGAAAGDASLVTSVAGLAPADRLTLVVALAALALMGLLGWLVAQLLGQNGRILARLDALEERLVSGAFGPEAVDSPVDADHAGHEHAVGLPVGTPAPAFQLPGLRGETMSLEALLAAERPVMLLFTDPGCGPCNALMPDLGRWQEEHADRLTIAILSRGPVDANRAKSDEHGLVRVLLQQDYEVADAYQAHGTPSAVLVNPDGTIGSHVSPGADAIRSLVARALGHAPAAPTPNGQEHAHAQTARPLPTPGASIGQPAPALRLPDLNGKLVDLGDLRGKKTLVVFWNTGCGFCQQMLPDLKAWEANRRAGAPELLVVSSSSLEDNRAMGLRSTVLLDQGFNAGRSFGANGTPMGVLIDEEGRIASDVAAGAVAVMALAGPSPRT